jgi:hypothetical protein
MRIGMVSFLLTVAAAQAAAQPAPAPPPRDAIADLLDRSVPPPKDEDEPDTAGQPRAPADAEPEASPLPQAGRQAGPQTAPQTGPQIGPQPPFAPPPRQQLNAPVRVDETGKTPDAPPTVRDMAYDARIRSSFASAESYQGPLEGGWTLSTADQPLYALQLVDRRDRLEGVWRDLRRRGAINGSGLVDDMQRQGGALILRFTPQPGAETSVATLRESGGGVWTGELAEAGRRRTVTLRHTSP